MIYKITKFIHINLDHLDSIKLEKFTNSAEIEFNLQSGKRHIVFYNSDREAEEAYTKYIADWTKYLTRKE